MTIGIFLNRIGIFSSVCLCSLLMCAPSISYPITYYTKEASESTKADDPTSAYGKYQDLIQVVECEKDRDRYGDYHDYGYWAGKTWCGTRVSPGFWVYVYPNWYIWKKNIPPEAEAN